jgi:hypothetical protein
MTLFTLYLLQRQRANFCGDPGREGEEGVAVVDARPRKPETEAAKIFRRRDFRFQGVGRAVTVVGAGVVLFTFLHIGQNVFGQNVFAQIFIPDLWRIFHPKTSDVKESDNWEQFCLI